MKDLQGIAAIVTGGASGMGAETARILAEKGARVALFDMNEELAKKMARSINGIAVFCDVSNPQSAQEAIILAQKEHGPARICVNCAGIAPAKRIVGRDGPMELEAFIKVININLIGTFNIMRLAAAEMAKLAPVSESGERGVIINTASVSAFEGQIGQAAYSASKGGVVSMTLPAAREFARIGLRVMTIAPGIMDTPMMASMPVEVQKSLAEMVPFPSRLGSTREFAELVLHIIENEYLNGTVIRLDAAIRMQPK